MNNLHISMQVEHCLYNLSEYSTRSKLSYLAIGQLFNIFSQANTLNVVGYKVDLLGTIY